MSHILAATTPPPATVTANIQQSKPSKTAQAPIQPPTQTPAPSSADGKAKKDGERTFFIFLHLIS